MQICLYLANTCLRQPLFWFFLSYLVNTGFDCIDISFSYCSRNTYVVKVLCRGVSDELVATKYVFVDKYENYLVIPNTLLTWPMLKVCLSL